jgi:hypothetical protein
MSVATERDAAQHVKVVAGATLQIQSLLTITKL